MKDIITIRKNTVGQFLHDARSEAKLTQKQVSSKLGYHTQFVSNWERGLSMPPPEAVPQLVNLYNLDTDRFLSSVRRFQYALADQKVAVFQERLGGGSSEV